MNVSKTIISSIAAVSVVGAIGLAYAQTTPTPTPTEVPANSTGPMTPPAAQSPTTTPTQVTPSPQLATPVPATPMPDATINSTVNTPRTDGMSNERAAQVDRN